LKTKIPRSLYQKRYRDRGTKITSWYHPWFRSLLPALRLEPSINGRSHDYGTLPSGSTLQNKWISSCHSLV